MLERSTAAAPASRETNLPAAPRAWCHACRRWQPCAHHQGTTDWQTTPVFACLACGQVVHDTTLAPLDVRGDAPVPAP
jgi:hypothetical protein